MRLALSREEDIAIISSAVNKKKKKIVSSISKLCRKNTCFLETVNYTSKMFRSETRNGMNRMNAVHSNASSSSSNRRR